MLLILIFVLPGWLVKDYLILQSPYALTTGSALTPELELRGGCDGFWQPKFKTCTKLNAWYASEVYENNITIADWKKLGATEDRDYSDTLHEIRCWMWNNYGNAEDSVRSAAIKKMGGIDKCTTPGLAAIDATILMNNGKKGLAISMSEWYPQEFDVKATTFVPT